MVRMASRSTHKPCLVDNWSSPSHAPRSKTLARPVSAHARRRPATTRPSKHYPRPASAPRSGRGAFSARSTSTPQPHISPVLISRRPSSAAYVAPWRQKKSSQVSNRSASSTAGRDLARFCATHAPRYTQWTLLANNGNTPHKRIHPEIIPQSFGETGNGSIHNSDLVNKYVHNYKGSTKPASRSRV